MKKNILALLLIAITGFNSFSQQIKEFDITTIKKAVTDSASATSYQSLLKKFNQAPRYLYPYEGAIVYYGKLFTKNFDGLNELLSLKSFNLLIAKKNFEEIIVKGERILEHDPTSLKTLIALAASYLQTGDTAKSILTRAKVNLLIPSILMYGNGGSDSTTIKVTSVEDEYVLMDLLKIRRKSRKTIKRKNSFIDIWKIKKSDSTAAEKELFFEVLYAF